MRILIAYAFPGQAEVQTLQKLVEQYLLGPYKAFLTHIAVAVRRQSELQDFLFDPTTEFKNPGSERSFAALDMVVVLGDPNLLPWSPAARQLYYLVKQCLRASKPCFLSGCGMQILSFLCSMGADRPRISRAFRRSGSGPPDEELERHVEEGELVVDGSNGDLYRLEELPAVDPAAQDLPTEWRSYKNVGVHFVHSAESTAATSVLGPIRLGSAARRSTPMRIGSGRTSVALRSETTVHIIKQHGQHWLLRDLPVTFQVSARHLWEVHEPPPRLLEYLAGSARGPQVVSLGLVVGVQFLVSPRFPETCTLFRSWMLQVLDATRTGTLPTLPDVLGLEVISLQKDRAASATSRGNTPAEHGAPTPVSFLGGAERSTPSPPPCATDAAGYTSTATPDFVLQLRPEERLSPVLKEFAKHEVRRMLHPALVGADKLLVQAEAPIRKVVRVKAPSKRPYCRWKEFARAGELMDPRPQLHLGGNYVQATPSLPHVLHDFRPEDRSKWLGGDILPGGDGWDSAPRPRSAPRQRPGTATRRPSEGRSRPATAQPR